MFHNIARYVFFYVGDTYSVLRSLFPWAQPKGPGWTKPSPGWTKPSRRGGAGRSRAQSSSSSASALSIIVLATSFRAFLLGLRRARSQPSHGFQPHFDLT